MIFLHYECDTTWQCSVHHPCANKRRAGLGFAEELLERGFNVILHGRNEDKLTQLRSKFKDSYPTSEIRTIAADAASFTQADVERIVAAVADIPLTILINNVGGTASLSRNFKTYTQTTSWEVDSLLDINVRCTLQITTALLPKLAQSEGRSLIMNTGSKAAVGMPYISLYSATKALLSAWTLATAAELKAENVPVDMMCILVGETQSGQNRLQESFFVPSSRTMARSALNRIGCGYTVVSAYWPHALQGFGTDTLPRSWLDYFVVKALQPLAKSDKEVW